MSFSSRSLRRAVLPAAVFAGAMLFHYLWLVNFPEQDPAQSRWLTLPGSDNSAWGRYLEAQSYWLGYTYALSLAFAAYAFRRYHEVRLSAARNAAIGGFTFSGVMAVVGCFLLGCCGSPMLAIYIGFFGAAFVSFAKPLVAGVTTLSVAVGVWWIYRQPKSSCTDTGCACD